MTSVTRMLREQRLRYAVKRETDRQNVTLEEVFLDTLVAQAMENIDAAFPDEDARMDASERAERSLQPVIAALSEHSFASYADFVAVSDVKEFPWSRSAAA